MFLNFHKLFFANACSGRGFVGGKCLQNHALQTALPNRKRRWIIFTPILNPIQSYTECHSVVYWILFSRILNYPHFRRCSGRGWTVTAWWLETDVFGFWNVVTKWNSEMWFSKHCYSSFSFSFVFMFNRRISMMILQALQNLLLFVIL